ncbi:adenosylcobalamin-dependent ribonucleoside-diphosphate reductase [Candidatus Micrarchaeota archaeon]|nr:adenosylcobalamin-dependent ribonucleoside-diphosphate reductase [Candidatus Micrarchaeota archaeon]
MIDKISKRDGSIAKFDEGKIKEAIWKSVQAVGGKDRSESDKNADLAIQIINQKFKDSVPSVEDVQDAVEKALIERGHATTAKAYILYRHKKSVERELKGILGVKDDLKLSINSVQVLERRYLLKDEKGKIIETPGQLVRRVAKFIASGEKLFGGDDDACKNFEHAFHEIMSKFEFMPNSPTLMNAGTGIGQLSACFVLGIGDDLEGIFESVKNTAVIHKSGGGTGFSFSFLRPKGDFVKSTSGVASGPISFMTVFDVATNVVKQGGKRRGANMGVLEVWHPDIEEFISVKQTPGVLENFNISVGVDDKFMEAVDKDTEYELLNPRTKQPVRKIKARSLFNLISYSAWKSAEPGLLFMDTINNTNPTPKQRITATNPCGEVPMPNYESCNLGSINLAKFVEMNWSKTDWKKKIDWNRLRYVTRLGVQFLDNVIELNKYPIEKIKENTQFNRRIGLGVMGFAKMLFRIGVSYDSNLALEIGDEIMKFITSEARKMSHELGRARGSFPGFADSIWAEKYDAMRNATVTSIAPTGTISMIADTSSGIEPMFSIAYVKVVMDGARLYYSEDTFEHVLKVRGLYSNELMQSVIESGSVQDMENIPKDIRDVFRVAYDITPDSHVKMQAAFQKHTDLAVSKTINMPAETSVEDIQKAYMLAWKTGCKGVTVYRDGSRGEGVLTKAKPTPKPSEMQAGGGQ